MALPGFDSALVRRKATLELPRRWGMEGPDLPTEVAEGLEERLEQDPENVEIRAKLLGYYFLRQFHNPAYKERRARHILWIVEFMPESGLAFLPYIRLDTDQDAYEKARLLWLEHVSRGEASRELLENAALFLSSRDPELALQLWERAAPH